MRPPAAQGRPALAQASVLLAALVLSVSLADPITPPTLDSLRSRWQRVRTCNPAGARVPCVMANASQTGPDKHLCLDLGCCFDVANGTCYKANDQSVPAVPSVVRYAGSQAVPSMSNLAGQLQAAHDGDPIGISCTTFPPLSQTCDAGVAFAGNTIINGLSAASAAVNSSFQWAAYELKRESLVPLSSTNPVKVSTTVRMPFGGNAVLLQITLEAASTSPLNVSFDLSPIFRDYANSTWGFGIPHPPGPAGHIANISSVSGAAPALVVIDTVSPAVAAVRFAGRQPAQLTRRSAAVFNAGFQLVGAPVYTLNVVLCVGSGPAAEQLQQAESLSANFDLVFQAAAQQWESFWSGSFAPNVSFPGNFPLLTTDDAELARTYYMGLLSLLATGHRSSLTEDRVLFTSAGPVCAVSTLYVWDSTLNTVLWSLLDPDTFLWALEKWFIMGPHSHYAYDYVSQQAIGPWYAFNDIQLFKSLRRFVGLRGVESLRTMLAGKPIGARLQELAIAWQSLPSLSARPVRRSAQPPAMHADAAVAARACNVTGGWLGFWVDGHRWSSGTASLEEGEGGALVATYDAPGWDRGNGTLSFPFATLDLYSEGRIKVTLKGKVSGNCSTIVWDNLSEWCRAGVGRCALPPTPSPPAPPTPGSLVDYGGASNLLECVPTYIHKVPSLNAANVWMMREAAALVENHTHAALLTAWAANLSSNVRQRLYVNGSEGGFWACEMPTGERVPVRHIIDFVTIGPALREDLSQGQRDEMAAFVTRELRTPHWLRALSLADPAAPASDRKDHGPWGSYDGWVGEAVEAYCALGRYGEALALTRNSSVVYDRGPGGQSHQVFGLDNTDMLDIPGKAHADQQYLATSGAVISNRVITGLFGVDPPAADWTDPEQVLRDASEDRGFDGTLSGLLLAGRRFTIQSRAGHGLSIEEEL